MIYEYKLACIEAGLSDEQIKEIEQVFDTEYKSIQYDQEKREKYQMEILHIEGMIGPDGEIGSFDPEDHSVNIEEDYIRRCDMEHLQDILAELSDDDREFILVCFAYETSYIKRLGERFGLTPDAVRWKKKRLLKELQKKFFEEK